MPDYSKLRISLPEEYNMNAADFGRVQLVNVPNWKTLFPKMYERYKAVGWTDDKLGKMTRGWAAWEDWLWGTSGLPFVAPNGTPLVCGSHRMVDFHKPWSIGVTHPLTQAFGRYDGYNSHPTEASGSEIDIWLDQYVDDPALKLVVPQLGTTAQQMKVGIKTTTTGNDGSAAGYTEVGQFTNFYLKGNRVGYHKQGELIVGYLGWDCGTNSACGFLHSHGTDIPYMFARGTPVNGMGPLTAMNCNVAGIAIVGGAQNSFNFAGGVEVDDCPTGVLAIAGFGREAGGRAKFNFLKIETGVSSEDRGPYKGTIVADLNGQFNFTFDMVNYAASFVHTDSLFIVDNKLSNGSPQYSQFKASLQGYGYKHIVHDKVKGHLYSSPGDHCPIDIQWQEDRGLTTNRNVTSTPTTSKVRLGFQRFVNGAWTPNLDHASGTPAYNYQGPQGTVTPPPVNPPPVDPPTNPPTTVLKYTETRTTATTATTRKTAPATLGTVTSVKLVNLKLSAVTIMTWINSALFVGQDGVLWVAANGGMVSTGIKPTAGTAINATVNIGSALTHTIGSPNGSTAIFTGTIEHY